MAYCGGKGELYKFSCILEKMCYIKSRFRQLYNATMSAGLLFKGFTLIFYFYKMLYGSFISQIFLNLFNVFG